MGDDSKFSYYLIKSLTRKALQEIPTGSWAISNVFEEDANGEKYPLFIEQIPFTNERQLIWEQLKEHKLTGKLLHVFEKLSDARSMFEYDYDHTDDGWRPEE